MRAHLLAGPVAPRHLRHLTALCAVALMVCCLPALAAEAPSTEPMAPAPVEGEQASLETPAPATPEAAPADEGFWLGDAYRYGRAGLLERTARDLVAIPANIGRWDGTDWGVFLSITTIVGGMMVPFETSPDVYFQRASRENLGEWRNHTWGPITDTVVWGGIFVAMGSTFLVGHFDNRPVLLEATSLLSEAFLLGQISQFVFKFAMGREGPENGDGTGRILGPVAFFGLFPSGTPSGHASTFFALMGALNTYVDDWRLTAAMVPVGLIFGLTLVISEYHFASDVVWGAAMGYALGTWVVNHRRSNRALPKKGEQDLWQWLVMPTLDTRTGTAGAALTVVF